MAGGGPPLQPAFVRKLVRDRALAGVATGVVGPVRVGSRTTGANAMDDVKGVVAPTVLEGRRPRAPDEILLARKTAERLHVVLGDRVSVHSGNGTARLRVVGLGVVPASKWNKLGEGAAMRFAALHRIQPESKANAAEIRIASGADRPAAFARLRALADGPSSAVTPADVANFGGVSRMPFLIALVFVLAAVAALAHALLTSIRRRRRDVAVLKTLGFTRTQVVQTIGWQASTIAAVGLLAGVPLGLGVGRFTWNLFAIDLGVVPEAMTPVGATFLVAPVALLLANLIAALPALTAARTQPAAVLRAE
jgi:ABC-type lipoprotein release transport system permease subunit